MYRHYLKMSKRPNLVHKDKANDKYGSSVDTAQRTDLCSRTTFRIIDLFPSSGEIG